MEGGQLLGQRAECRIALRLWVALLGSVRLCLFIWPRSCSELTPAFLGSCSEGQANFGVTLRKPGGPFAIL